MKNKVIALYGRPGCGKSTAAIRNVVEFASSGLNVLFLYHEGTPRHMIRRIYAAMLGIKNEYMLTQLTDEGRKNAEQAVKEHPAINHINTACLGLGQTDFSAIEKEFNSVVQKPDVVIIDSIEYLFEPCERPYENEAGLMEKIGEFAKANDCLVMFTAQLPKSGALPSYISKPTFLDSDKDIEWSVKFVTKQ